MIVLIVVCVNIYGLKLSWNQSRLLHNLESINFDMAVISEKRISGKHVLAHIFAVYEIFPSCGLSGMGGGAASKGDVFRLVDVYIPSGAGRPDFLKHQETFLGRSCTGGILEYYFGNTE